jgi:hypothetical protein
LSTKTLEVIFLIISSVCIFEIGIYWGFIFDYKTFDFSNGTLAVLACFNSSLIFIFSELWFSKLEILKNYASLPVIVVGIYVGIVWLEHGLGWGWPNRLFMEYLNEKTNIIWNICMVIMIGLASVSSSTIIYLMIALRNRFNSK